MPSVRPGLRATRRRACPCDPPGPRDLPQALQDRVGGFHANGTEFQDAFVYYADTLFKELGPYVKLWMT